MIARDDDPRLEPYRHVGDPRWLEAQGLFVAEGRLVVERLLAENDYDVQSVLVTPAAHDAIATAIASWVTARASEDRLLIAPQTLLNAITGFNFHRGCLALVHRPAVERTLDAFANARRLVVLEGVGNPDNVGGIFRSAAALGADGVVLDPACADPLYRKAVRTSMGAVLRLPFVRATPWPASLRTLRDMGFTLAALTPSGSVTIEQFAATHGTDARVAVLAGAEGPGLSAAAHADAHETVRIAIDPRSDSLNVVVAVSIALQRLSG